MDPVAVSIDVPAERADVYSYLDVLANHESFTDHMLRHWSCSGPSAGVGARAQVTSVLGGRRERVDIEVIEAVEGESTRERNVGQRSHRVGVGTYELTDLPAGGTTISFTYAWERAPLADRLLAPLVRRIMRKALRRAMERLAAELGPGGAGAPAALST
jgi:polyketide cyclase/dehydrase/lipid transport protein